MSRPQLLESALACVPPMLGVRAGQRFRGRVREAVFGRILLAVLPGVGVRPIAGAGARGGANMNSMMIDHVPRAMDRVTGGAAAERVAGSVRWWNG